MQLQVVRPLISLLSSSPAACQSHAAAALCNISASSSTAREQVLELGGMQPLITLLTSSSAECQKGASIVILNVELCTLLGVMGKKLHGRNC